MRRIITTLLVTAALAAPVAEATAAVKATASKKKVVTKRFSGDVVGVDRWGDIQVTIVVRKTTITTGSRKTVTRKLTGLSVPTYPNHTDRSVFINSQALPILRSEALRAQSAKIDLVSGASETSQSFAESLQSAILKARRA